MRVTEDTTSPLTDPRSADASRAGGKGANLAALARAGLPVPAGFIVSTTAYLDFVDVHGLTALIGRETAGLGDDPDSAEVVSARLREAFDAAPMSAGTREAITAAYTALGGGPVAVRSSATAEDLPEASFAGQQETVLNVVGAEDVCDAVRLCWSSLWTARAIAYRRRQGMGNEHLAVAVVVQQMVPAEVAGVLFTADPLSGRRDHTVIEAFAGLGEAVVSGRVTPERWTIDTRSRTVVSGPERAEARRTTLSHGQLNALVGLGSRAAKLLGVPQDMEWAIADGRCSVLQSRPITSLFPLPARSDQPGLRVYLSLLRLSQGIDEPFTPAGVEFFRQLSAEAIRRVLIGHHGPDSGEPPPWLPTVAGRIYIDATPALQRPRLAAKWATALRKKDPGASESMREWLAHNSSRLPKTRRPALPRGLVRWVPTVLAGLVAALATPVRARRRLFNDADAQLAALEQQADELTSPLDRAEFVYRVLPVPTYRVISKQLPAVYAEQLLRILAERLLQRWLGTSTGFEPLRRWLPHDPTLAMGTALARLARDYAAAGIEPAPDSPGVAQFLAVYGHRAPDREVDLGLPRFADDPGYVVELIRGYLGSSEPARMLARSEEGSAQARTAADDLVAQVRRRTGPVRAAILRSLINRYRELGGLRERPKFDMVRAVALGRRTLRQAGVALVAEGLLDEPEDVFFLDISDLRTALTGGPADLPAVAAANRRAFDRELARRAVPRMLVSDGETVYGPSTAPVSGRPDLLVGDQISPGVYEGIVRVLDSPVGARLQPGEILVAASTDPGWTPLFLLAGAMIMEVGGVISHGAVVAREYGIPAVAGIADATTRLHSGQRVRVDGTAGTVTVLEPSNHSEATTARNLVR